MASSAHSRRAPHAGSDQQEQVREDRRRSTSFSLWSFSTMEEAAARWEATLQAVTGTRQQSRERLRAAVSQHAKLCEQIGPQAIKDRVWNRLRKKKDTPGPLHELDAIRTTLATLAVERRSAEDQVLAAIQGFRVYSNQVLHRLQPTPRDPHDPLAHHDHALHLATANNLIATIHYSHAFGERTYAGDTAKLMWQIWRNESLVHNHSHRASAARHATALAERLLHAAEAEYQRTYQQHREATNRLMAALNATGAARNVLPGSRAAAEGAGGVDDDDDGERFAAERERWVAWSRRGLADYATLGTFPEPPGWRCGDVEGCRERRAGGRALRVCECSVREAVRGLGKEDLKWVRTHFHPDRFRRCPEEKRVVFGRMAGEVMVVVNEVWGQRAAAGG